MLKLFTATIKDGTLVLPAGADLGRSRDGDEVQVAVEVADALDRAGAVYMATRPSQFGARDVRSKSGQATVGQLSPEEAAAVRIFEETGDAGPLEALGYEHASGASGS